MWTVLIRSLYPYYPAQKSLRLKAWTIKWASAAVKYSTTPQRPRIIVLCTSLKDPGLATCPFKDLKMSPSPSLSQSLMSQRKTLPQQSRPKNLPKCPRSRRRLLPNHLRRNGQDLPGTLMIHQIGLLPRPQQKVVVLEREMRRGGFRAQTQPRHRPHLLNCRLLSAKRTRKDHERLSPHHILVANPADLVKPSQPPKEYYQRESQILQLLRLSWRATKGLVFAKLSEKGVNQSPTSGPGIHPL